MQIEILEEEVGYIVKLEGEFFRKCKTYSELFLTITNLIRSKYQKNAEGLA